MLEFGNQEKENVYKLFVKKIREAGFVRLICLSREIGHFAGLFAVISILEKELIKHEVVWERREKEEEEEVFEIGIGAECRIKKGAVLCTQKEKGKKEVIFLCGETLEMAVFNLCKGVGHLTPDCLWSICVSIYGKADQIEEAEWRRPIRKGIEDEKSEEEEEYGSFEEKENLHLERTCMPDVYKEIEAEISRLEREDKEKRSVQIENSVYFPFGKWTTFYDAILNDFGVIEDLGLFFQKKNTKHCLLENAEYLLNQFLAKLGISISSAKEASMNNLIGPIQKTLQRSFNKRQTYFKHYQYNMGFTHIEVFYMLCYLIKKGQLIEAVFAFRNIKYIDEKKGLSEYKRVVQDIKKGVERRKVLRVNGVGVVLIPKQVISFQSKNELMLMKKVFANIYLLCKSRNPNKKIIMASYIEENMIYRMFFSINNKIQWIDTEEKTFNECVKGILQSMEEIDR